MYRNRIDSEEKLQTVSLILNSKESLRYAAEMLGIRFPSITTVDSHLSERR